MDEEAQKKADAEGNLVAFRKVNAQLTAPCNPIDFCPQAQITGQMDNSISNYYTIVTLYDRAYFLNDRNLLHIKANSFFAWPFCIEMFYL